MWVKQEKSKGINSSVAMGVNTSDYCGWGRGEDKAFLSPPEVAMLFQLWQKNVENNLAENDAKNALHSAGEAFSAWRIAYPENNSFPDLKIEMTKVVSALKECTQKSPITEADWKEAKNTGDFFLNLCGVISDDSWEALYRKATKAEPSSANVGAAFRLEIPNLPSAASEYLSLHDVLRRTPFFHLNPQWLKDGYSSEDGKSIKDLWIKKDATTRPLWLSNVNMEPDVSARDYFLAFAIPSLSCAAGYEAETISNEGKSKNMQKQFKTSETVWRKKSNAWKHSDYKLAPYQMNFKFYDEMVRIAK